MPAWEVFEHRLQPVRREHLLFLGCTQEDPMHRALTYQRHNQTIFEISPLILLYCVVSLPLAAQTPVPDQTPQKPVPRVTTTVVVQDQASDDYLPTDSSVGSLETLPLASEIGRASCRERV